MTTKGKHLTVEDRNYIEDALNAQYTLTEIAKHLRKDPTTISKEVKRNRIQMGKHKQNEHLSCHRQKQCKRKHICTERCDQVCKKCATLNCYRICPDYTPKICSTLMRFPHVCNGCTRKIGCRLNKYKYRAKVANTNYKEVLKTSREGVSITPQALSDLDNLISPLIKRGQSLSHIYAHHKHDIECCERTLYSYFDKNMFTVRNIDLPRKVRYKPRKRKATIDKTSPIHRTHRSYDDFSAYLEANPETSVVEMDTVYGTKGGKVLLTLFFRNCSLMLAFLLKTCTQTAVNQVFDDLYKHLGKEVFQQTFPIILTDNGSEFKDPESIEYDDHGERRTKLFYCDPMASYQKARIEKNHEYIRYILPKGKSFENLTQEKVTLMMNHINSTARASLNGNSPFQLARLLLDDALLKKNSLQCIPADEVHLKPALLKA